jgi:hypothetical protein
MSCHGRLAEKLLRTAQMTSRPLKALGITIPRLLLQRADEIIK